MVEKTINAYQIVVYSVLVSLMNEEYYLAKWQATGYANEKSFEVAVLGDIINIVIVMFI